MGVEKYLSKLQEQEAIKKGSRLSCKVCGRVAIIKKAGRGPLVCCGENMSVTGTVVEAGWSGTPKGWDKESIKKFAKSLAKDGAKKEDFFDKCVNKMKGKIDDPEAFCASVKDEVYGGDKASTYWRGKGKSEKQAKEKIKQMRAKFKK